MTQGPRGGSAAPTAPPDDPATDERPASGAGADAPGNGHTDASWGAATTTATSAHQQAGGASPDSPTDSLPATPPHAPHQQVTGKQPAVPQATTQQSGTQHSGTQHSGTQQATTQQATAHQSTTQQPTTHQGRQPGLAPNQGAVPPGRDLRHQAASPAQVPPPQVPPGQTRPPGGAPAGQQANRRPGAAARRGPRRARLQLRHVDPWTVLKFSCVLSVALFFVWLIVVGVLFGILDGAGIIGKINNVYTTLEGGNAQNPVTAGVVFGGAAIVGVVNIVLFIALSTVGSIIYNLCADLVGGVEVTLSER